MALLPLTASRGAKYPILNHIPARQPIYSYQHGMQWLQ